MAPKKAELAAKRVKLASKTGNLVPNVANLTPLTAKLAPQIAHLVRKTSKLAPKTNTLEAKTISAITLLTIVLIRMHLMKECNLLLHVGSQHISLGKAATNRDCFSLIGSER